MKEARALAKEICGERTLEKGHCRQRKQVEDSEVGAYMDCSRNNKVAIGLEQSEGTVGDEGMSVVVVQIM